jgi:geranylgeranyl reductase family protein
VKNIIEEIAIIGGGPAGAYLGYLLAKKGMHPVIFDHTHPREKPCGGGISVLAIEKFPFLNEIQEPKAPDNKFEFIASKDLSIMTSGKKSTWSLSRARFDKFLLDKAIENGCRLIPEQVKGIKNKNNIWEINTTEGQYQAKLIIGADGVNSIVRKKILGPIPKEDVGVCYGCYATSEKNEATRIIFLKDRQGYAWCFPRHDHLSIGVGVDSSNSKDVKKLFSEIITTYYPHIKIESKWGAKIPNIKDPQFYKLPCAGENWILVGDAAGHVDSSTGEGITYALWSAELASHAIINKDPSSFNSLWRKEYGDNLIGSCKSRDLFYNPLVLEYSIRLAKRSKTLSNFFYELVTNQIPQNILFNRIVKDTPKIIMEFISSKIRS